MITIPNCGGQNITEFYASSRRSSLYKTLRVSFKFYFHKRLSYADHYNFLSPIKISLQCIRS